MKGKFLNVFQVEVYGQTHPQSVVFTNVTTVRPTWPPTPPPIRGKATVRGVQLYSSILIKYNFYTLILKKSTHRYIQLLTFAYKRLLNKPYENEVILTGQNPPLKCCQHLET